MSAVAEYAARLVADERTPRKSRLRRVDMTQDKKARNANGRSSIYFSEADQSWHGRVTMGVRDDGRPDRRHVRGKHKAK